MPQRIDRDGLMKFAEAGRGNPGRRGTNKVHTVMEGQYRSLSTVGKHAPVVVDEPLHLFGQDTAPAPGEIVLSGLGGCLAVGITAVAAWKQVPLSRLELFLEGDIGNPAALEIEVEALSTDAVRLQPGMKARILRWGGEFGVKIYLALFLANIHSDSAHQWARTETGDTA